MIDSTSSTSASCSWVGPRIIDKVAAAQCAGQRFYALEFFPPATIEGARNLIPRMDRLAQLQPPPLFVDVTWTLSAGKRALETLVAAKAVCALDVQMHLSCTDLTRETAELVLTDAAQAGIRGIMVLRGDPPTGSKEWQPIEDGFKNPGELVSFIKHKYGDHFSISVAGHPGGHPAHQNASQESQLDYLASKVKTGADMIVTQMIFAAAEYKSFVDACRARGITCPIIPGVLCIPSHRTQLEAILEHCGVAPPADLMEALDAAVASAAAAGGGPAAASAAMGRAGTDYVERLCKELLDNGAPGIYLFTMNLERSVAALIPRLPFAAADSPAATSPSAAAAAAAAAVPAAAAAAGVQAAPLATAGGKGGGGGKGEAGWGGCQQRTLPWHRPRYKETVRPIFWASNPLSYLSRTYFIRPTPHGDQSQPSHDTSTVPHLLPGMGAAGDEGTLYSHHSLVGRRLGSKAERRYMWGETPTCEEDIFDVFERFVMGRVPRLPWCDRIEKETLVAGFLKPLVVLNHFGYLTINSQPRINGKPSEDPSFGWGPAGGHVYQKAYLEFFCSPVNLDRLMAALDSFPSITLMAYDVTGRRRRVLCGSRKRTDGAEPDPDERHVAAVTWGVFDSMEVLQPTVVDSAWFQVWSEEAFALWDSAWASIYPPDSEAWRLTKNMMSTYWHVYMVDNDFVQGDIFNIFSHVLGVDPAAGSPVIRPRLTTPAA